MCARLWRPVATSLHDYVACLQAREAERLASELRTCRARLAEMEGQQLELRKAQAAVAEVHGLRASLEEARAQLVEMDRWAVPYSLRAG